MPEPATPEGRRRRHLGALGLAPWYRRDWALENALVVVAVVALAASYRRFPLSRLS